MHEPPFKPRRTVLLAIILAIASPAVLDAQASATGNSPSLKQLSLEELMSLEVTSVSRRPEKLSESASAIQVVTHDEIRRAGVTRLPEAFRLVSNLEVAQLDSRQWAVSSRGFNSPLANKLLVLIDGRTVYSPLFAGVFWEIQDVMMEDIDRIEVISGPGATQWGSNAVNGVISVTSRSARDTQGLFVEAGIGTELHRHAAARYGGTVSHATHYRVYAQQTERDGAVLADGTDAQGGHRITQAGFRMDHAAGDTETFTVQGDLYESRMLASGANPDGVTQGGNIVMRWTRAVAVDSEMQLQVYYDRVHRDAVSAFNDSLDTFDADFQHRLPAGDGHDIVWGAGFRHIDDNFRSGAIVLVPQRLRQQTYSAFVQDEIAIIPDRAHVTLGVKMEHNDYTGLEIQPNARLTWKADDRQTVWGAISRAMRSPSRLDRDLLLVPGPDFESEELIAFELGYRWKAHERLGLSATAYLHEYDDLRSVETVGGTPPVVVGNGQAGRGEGIEISVDARVTDFWRVRAGYTVQDLDVWAKPGSTDTSSGQAEAADPHHYGTLHSMLDLPGAFTLDAMFRVVGDVTNPRVPVPDYEELDVRVAWRPTPAVEISIVGRNLLHDQHVEFGDPATAQSVERSVSGNVAWWF